MFLRAEVAPTASEVRLETKSDETACFRVFLSERHVLWVVDGQHRRHGADMVLEFLEHVRTTGKYPSKGAVLFADKGRPVSEAEMQVWNEAYDAARAYATLTVEVHLGLEIEQERQLFHDLNRLGKRSILRLRYSLIAPTQLLSSSNANLRSDLAMQLADSEPKDWSEDSGALVLKDAVAINAIAFLNKGNIAGATPAIIEPRESVVFQMWNRICEIPDFGSGRAKERTVAAQPVVLKAIAKITYDLNFSNRRPENGNELFVQFMDRLTDVDFSHRNPMWRYYELTAGERLDKRLSDLVRYLPEQDDSVNRDLGSMQGEFMRFGAKHNDIYPVLADMLRWATGLPSRRES